MDKIVDHQKTSILSRRRLPRFATRKTVLWTPDGLFRRTRIGKLKNLNLHGFQLCTRETLRSGRRILIRISSAIGLPAICIWADENKTNASPLSGWKWEPTNEEQQNEISRLNHQFQNEVQDRRLNNNCGTRRLRDAISQTSVLNPDTFPVYRRSINDRRTCERRLIHTDAPEEKRKQLDRRVHTRRSTGASYVPERTEFLQNIASIGTILRDALVPHLPHPIVRLLVGEGKFVFIAHPRDQKDVTRMFPFAKWLPEKWIKRWFSRQRPFIASRIRGLKNGNGDPLEGWFLIAPRWTVQMMKNNDEARDCILETAKLAEKIGARIAGLGAFTSIVTHDGKDLIGKTKIGLTTGNPLSAAVAVQNVVKAASLVGLNLRKSVVAVVGAGGSVGSGCARLLSKISGRLLLVDINKSSLDILVDSLPNLECRIEKHHDLKHIHEVDVVVVATNTPGAIIHSEHLKEGAIAVDCAQPKNVSREVPQTRSDVIVIESAILNTPVIDCHFDLDLNQHEALGCLAETMVLTSIGWPSSYGVGKSQAHQMEEIYAAAKKAGFSLAYFRNSTGYVTEGIINHVKNIVASRGRID